MTTATAKWDRKKLAELWAQAEQKTSQVDGTVIRVGMGSCGLAAGASSVMEAFQAETQKCGISGVTLKPTGCVGLCYAEPTVDVRVPAMPPVLYGRVDAAGVRRIVREHLIERRLVSGCLLDPPYLESVGCAATAAASRFERYLVVCGGDACPVNVCQDLFQALSESVREHGRADAIQVVQGFCGGACPKHGPMIRVLPDQVVYRGVNLRDVDRIVLEHGVQGKPVRDLLPPALGPRTKTRPGGRIGPRLQERIVLRNSGWIDPESLEDYVLRDGYRALARVIFEMTPEAVIEELKKSGLRGRGGAGYPTWKKWMFTRETPADERYVICNADEGDPGAYMDRSTLEGDPFCILEALTIAGWTIGARHGLIYIRAEYPLAIQRLQRAIERAREVGLLGPDILGSGFDFDVEIRLGAGAFVCGEETALIASVEGCRGMPVPRPPFPSVRGLWKRPTLINNVETLANIPPILLRGGEAFARIGTPGSPGTKVFALTGKVRCSGLIEVPMGITLRQILEDLGGGVRGGKTFKAVQTGGPSGGVLSPSHLDTPIDYEALQQLGSIMGSGGMIVMDQDDCMVDIARFYMEFIVDESCGKCAPCRIGSRTLYNLFSKFAQGEGQQDDLVLVRDVALAMQKAALCGLGQTAPNPVLSGLRHFEAEFLVHINEKRCPSGRCRDLVTYTIDPQICIGCTVCARNCPAHCIQGERQKPHVIDLRRCVKCGQCYQLCKFGAVVRR